MSFIEKIANASCYVAAVFSFFFAALAAYSGISEGSFGMLAFSAICFLTGWLFWRAARNTVKKPKR